MSCNESDAQTSAYQHDIIPMKTKISYALGSLGSSIMSGIVFTSITFYYNIKLLADESLLQIAWLIFMIWNMINDPLFGFISDNTRHKLGRRIPYIRYGAVFYFILFILSWFPIAARGDQVGLFWNFLIVLLLFDTIFSIVGTCYFCLPAEMSLDSEERAKLGFISSAAYIIAILVQFVVPLVLLTGQDLTINEAFFPTMIVLGVVSSLLIFFTSYFLKENKFTQCQKSEKLFEGIKKTLKNKPFFIFEIANFSLTLFTTIITTGLFYFIDYVMQIDVVDLILHPTERWDINIALICMVVGLVLGAKITLKKVEAWQPKKVLLLSFGLISIGFVGFFIAGPFSNVNAIPSGIFWGMMTFGAAGAMICLPATTGDVIDWDEVITGTRREGVYAGFNALLTKPAISIANAAFLGLIGLLGFIKDQPVQTYEARIGIMFAFTILPAIFTIITVVALKFYPLDGPWWRAKKAELKILHVKKDEEYKISIGSERTSSAPAGAGSYMK